MALLVGLVPLWVACCVLYVHVSARGRLAWAPLAVRAPKSPEAYPTVREFLPGAAAEQSDLVVGDQLVRLGKADLRGVGPFGFVARAYEEVGPDLRVPVTFARSGTQGKTFLRLLPVASPWLFLPLTLSFVMVGVFTILCEPGSRQARAFFLASLAYSFHWTLFFGGPRLQTYAWAAIHFFSALVLLPLSLRTAMVFPEKLTLAGARTPAWPWLFAITGPIVNSTVFGAPLAPTVGLRALFVVNVAFLVALLVILTRNFRRANPIGRRQLKWIVYGFYIGVAPLLTADVITAFNPSLRWLHEISTAAFVLIPICICIAILRVNFIDIDRLISTTAVYSLLALVFLAGVLLGVPRAAQAMQDTIGIQAGYGQFALSFCLALVLAPGRRVLLPKVVQRFFPEQYELEVEVAALTRELTQHANLSTLLPFCGERVKLLWNLESCVLYGRNDGAYVPIFAQGSAIPSVFSEHGALSSTLQTQGSPLDVERWQRVAGAYLTPEDLMALEKLRAEMIVPLYRDKLLAAFVCLGPKRSGDIYTATDFALLATVGNALGVEFARHTEETWRSQVVNMYETLRGAMLEPSLMQLPPTSGAASE
jgi:hypothetical protein